MQLRERTEFYVSSNKVAELPNKMYDGQVLSGARRVKLGEAWFVVDDYDIDNVTENGHTILVIQCHCSPYTP